MEQTPFVQPPPQVRDDFVPPDAYVLPEYVRLEEATLWPKTWLIACRQEEIPNPGDYYVFDIGKESILIVRQKDAGIRAFYNVCQHRGRRLKDNLVGRTGDIIRCNFHGWRYNADGTLESILNEDDWSGCATFHRDELHLKPVRHEVWGGWVWVSMDPDIKPFREYLGEFAGLLEPYKFEEMGFQWYKTVITPCNWKIIVDAFNEAYHAPATHPWNFRHGWFGSTTKEYGIHGTFTVNSPFMEEIGEMVIQDPRLTGFRDWLDYFNSSMLKKGRCLVSPYALSALERVHAELPEGSDDVTIATEYGRFNREEAAKAGAPWPDELTPEFLAAAHTDFHIFPNTTLVPGPDGVLWHRMRPHGNDPSLAVWDLWYLERYPEGQAPPINREFFASPAEFKGQNPFLEEDFGNMEACHKGMWSRGFQGGRTNPVQERSVSNFHRVLYDYYAGKPWG